MYYIIIIINSQRHLPNFPLPNLLRPNFTPAKLSCYMVVVDVRLLLLIGAVNFPIVAMGEYLL